MRLLIVLLGVLERAACLNTINTNINANVNLNEVARVKCEYRQTVDEDSLVLNCSLLAGSVLSASANLLSNSMNQIDMNGMSFITNGNVGGQLDSSSAGSSSGNLNIRVGLDRAWRTPWESLSINLNIIRSLIWRRSKLSELGEFAFKDLNYLQSLDLSFNKLQQLNGFSFKNFELDVQVLDLSHNLFQTVPVDLFLNKRLQKLEVLRMNENPIVYLHRKPFELVRGSLKAIEFNYCQIRSIDTNAFDDMKQLESVSLIGNHLRHLNEYTFRDLALRVFYVHENPLACDCHMRWLINYIKNVDYQQQASYEIAQSSQMASGYLPKQSVGEAAQSLLKCDQPNSLKAKPHFLDINPDSFMCYVELAFRDELNEAEYETGEDAVLTCDIYGDPEPVVYWSFGNRPIEKALHNDVDKYYVHEIRAPAYASSFKNSLNAGPSGQSTNKTSELRIKNLQTSDYGVYTCTAEIAGSNNRKQIAFTLRQTGGGVAGIRGGGLVGGGVGLLASLFNTSAGSPLFGRPLSNTTLAILICIVLCLLLFIMLIGSFVCWRFRRQKMQNKQFEQQTLRRKEQEKLLSHEHLNGRKLLQHNHIGNHQEDLYAHAKFMDQLDCHNHNQLSNDSSATLISNNKASNSIRMAYPSHNGMPGQMPHMSDIYANHSLLTTTSTTTGSYLAHNSQQQQQAIAIDTSNQTPRLHLLSHQQHNGRLFKKP